MDLLIELKKRDLPMGMARADLEKHFGAPDKDEGGQLLWSVGKVEPESMSHAPRLEVSLDPSDSTVKEWGTRFSR